MISPYWRTRFVMRMTPLRMIFRLFPLYLKSRTSPLLMLILRIWRRKIRRNGVLRWWVAIVLVKLLLPFRISVTWSPLGNAPVSRICSRRFSIWDLLSGRLVMTFTYSLLPMILNSWTSCCPPWLWRTRRIWVLTRWSV